MPNLSHGTAGKAGSSFSGKEGDSYGTAKIIVSGTFPEKPVAKGSRSMVLVIQDSWVLGRGSRGWAPGLSTAKSRAESPAAADIGKRRRTEFFQKTWP